ncbi:hypothetical protein COB57_03065 [Candidatus Peregrinibacteria bacterium]|nr:MAG: hypothetical protein COB57_03065 [Candidatus Peregrinibacteria bacterium]
MASNLFEKRFIAIMIDILVISLWFFIPVVGGVILNEEYGIELPTSIPAFLVICIPLYFIYAPYFYGHTFGKKWMGLTIVREDGKKIAHWQAWVRYFISVTISNGFFCLGYFWVFVDKKHRTWHDIVSKTKVVLIKK